MVDLRGDAHRDDSLAVARKVNVPFAIPKLREKGIR